MSLNVLRKQLDDSRFCPLCQAAMYWVEAEQFDQDVTFHECSHCKHRLFQEPQHNCYCESCLSQRKRALTEAKRQERQIYQRRQKKDVVLKELHQLRFIDKLFLLSLLDEHIQEHTQHDEIVHWENIRYHAISPNFLFQNSLVKHLVKEQILVAQNDQSEEEHYFIQVRLDGYSEPSLFSITQQLRHWFYENLSLGVPFQSAQEVKDTLYLILYQEIVQFMQFYCRAWNIQISGNTRFQSFCYRLLDQLAVGQIYYLIQTALEYLHKEKLLKLRNDQFINTNFLRKTLELYRERALKEKWETYTLPRPQQLPLSKMSEIFLYRFLGYDENIFFQPIWRSWKKIEPRLKFYSEKRCMHCGSNELTVEYDASDYVTLSCRQCKHQDHYFTQ